MLVTNMKYRKLRQKLRMGMAAYCRQQGPDFGMFYMGVSKKVLKRFDKNSKVRHWTPRRRLGNEHTKNKSGLIRLQKGA